MRVETVISLALFKLYVRSGAELGYRSDVLDVLQGLAAKGVSLGGVRFRPTPEGIHSDEVAEFLGRLAMGGYIVQESPIRLTSYGIEGIQNHLRQLRDEKDAEVQQALEALDLDDVLPRRNAAAT